VPTLLHLNSRPSRPDAVHLNGSIFLTLIFRLLWLLAPAILLPGCARFHHELHENVYVSARQAYLHDRVAAVSNRVGLVSNGETLEVVEHGKRFIKVRTPKGEVGWLEDHAIIDDKLYTQFQNLAQKHAGDPVVAHGELRDDLYLHVLPGRDTPHFLLVAGNTKVQLLQRGIVAKGQTPGAPAPKPQAAIAGQPEPPPIPMEDWWLVRDVSGHTGWLLANRVDVDVPDEVAQYSESQRMVAAYPIATVIDDGTGREHKKSTKADKNSVKPRDISATESAPEPREITEYVTVLSPPHGGLPYDFDQIRVFTWSLNHHRYETAYRLHGLQGYLPVTISKENVNGQDEPTFTFQIADTPDVRVDPETGVTRPANPRTLSFRLEGNLVKRTGSDQAPIILTHDSSEKEAAKAKAAAKKKKH